MLKKIGVALKWFSMGAPGSARRNAKKGSRRF